MYGFYCLAEREPSLRMNSIRYLFPRRCDPYGVLAIELLNSLIFPIQGIFRYIIKKQGIRYGGKLFEYCILHIGIVENR